MKKLCLCLMILALVGCDQLAQLENKPEKKKAKSGLSDAIDTVVIQRGKMEAGRRTANRVRKLSADHQKDFEQALGE